MDTKINYKSAQYILGSIGTLGGLYYAFSKNKGALAYLGFALVGGIAGALAAAPEVDEKAVAVGSVCDERAEVAGDFAGYEVGAAAAGFEAALLAVDGADFRAFGVVEDREADGIREVVLGEFRG
jgi:hypothetical protein